MFGPHGNFTEQIEQQSQHSVTQGERCFPDTPRKFVGLTDPREFCRQINWSLNGKDGLLGIGFDKLIPVRLPQFRVSFVRPAA